MKLTTPAKYLRWIAVAAITGLALLPVTGRADDQAELIQKLLNRIDQQQKSIDQLEKKVNALESGQVVPATAILPTNTDTVAIQDLEQKVKILERNRELDAEAAEAKAKEAPRITAGAGGFAISSADTNFVLKFKGLVQVDSRRFFDDNSYLDGNDGFYLRRARPIIEGTVFRDFEFNLTPDFGGNTVQLFDAWLNYRNRPELQLKIGKFKSPVGFENLQSDATLPFNERSLVSNFVPNRNIGVQLWGDIEGGAVSYAGGVFNGAGDGRNPNNSDFNDSKEFAGRLAFQPFKNTDVNPLKGFGFGAAGSYTDVNSNSAALPGTTGGTLPGYVTSGLQQFFAYNPTTGTVVADGVHWRISPYAYYTWGPFGVLGEYITMNQGLAKSGTAARTTVADSAWQASIQWVLTGEDASFTGIVPRKPFNPAEGKWGAWQLVARFAQADLDQDAFPVFADGSLSAYRATSWAVGVNWWLNRNVRVMTSYSQTWFDGGGTVDPAISRTLVPPSTVTHQNESLFTTRVQLSF